MKYPDLTVLGSFGTAISKLPLQHKKKPHINTLNTFQDCL